MSRRARLLAALTAAISIASIGGQTYVFSGIIAERGGNSLHVLWVMLGYFTILTNLAVTLVCMALALGIWPRWWPEIGSTLGCLTVNILLVGLVYHLLLSGLWNPQGLHYASDQGLHTVVPLLFLILWWLEAPKAGLVFDHALSWLMYPLAYFLYAMARGALDGWYPYPFIDVVQLGYGRVALNAVVISVGLTVGGLVLIHVARKVVERA